MLGTASEVSLSLARFEQLFVQFLPWWTHRVAAVPVDLVLRSLDLHVPGYISLREFVTLMSLLIKPAKHVADLLKFVFRLFEAGVDYLDRRRLGDAVELVYIIAENADLVPEKSSPDAQLVDEALRWIGADAQHVTLAQFKQLAQAPSLYAALGLFAEPLANGGNGGAAAASSSSSSAAAAAPAPAAAAAAAAAVPPAASLIDFEVDWNAAAAAAPPADAAEAAKAEPDDLLAFGFVAPTSPAARPAGSSLISFDEF